jgi:hypothetical protein
MDSKILDVLEEAFVDELELVGDLGDLEGVIMQKLLTLGQGLLQRVVRRKPNGYEGSALACSCGGRKRFIGHRPREINTIFGWVEIPRAYYHCDNCKSSDVPYDRAVGLGDEQISPGLAKACCLLAVDDSFEESARKIEELLGQKVSPKTIERLVHQVGQKVVAGQDQELDAFRKDRQPPSAHAHPKRLYVTMDGTTVHERDGWHEAKAGRLYWEDDRCNYHSFTVGRFDDSQTFGWHVWLAACRCGVREADEVVFLGDGAAWIRNERDRHFGQATFIVDWYHGNEHIWDCGKILYGEGTAQAEQWSRQRETWLWEGCTRRLTDDLAQQMKRYRGVKREALETLHRYIMTNEWEMRYDVFRAKGYDIGSGAVEGACKHVIGKRLKQSGMIWKRPGSSATLALRVAWLNGHWNTLWASKPLAA